MKYDALKVFLAGRKQARIAMSFEEIAKAAGAQLPASAFRYPSWWANDPAHHAQARAWADAGYKTENVDIEAQRVTFVRVTPAGPGVREVPEVFSHKPKPVAMHPAYGALKGTFTISPDWDLTKPALDPEELAEWEANLERKADMIEAGMRRKK
jgi:hypothetical protein